MVQRPSRQESRRSSLQEVEEHRVTGAVPSCISAQGWPTVRIAEGFEGECGGKARRRRIWRLGATRPREPLRPCELGNGLRQEDGKVIDDLVVIYNFLMKNLVGWTRWWAFFGLLFHNQFHLPAEFPEAHPPTDIVLSAKAYAFSRCIDRN